MVCGMITDKIDKLMVKLFDDNKILEWIRSGEILNLENQWRINFSEFCPAKIVFSLIIILLEYLL